MSKRVVFIILTAIVVTGAAIAYVIVSSPKVATPVASSSPSTKPKPESSQSSASGAYLAYDGDAISKTPGTKLLFFHASWCPQCRALDTDIKATMLPDDVTIFKVDYDTSQGLRQKYGVTLQTTIVKVDDSGNLIKKYVAYDEPTFTSVKEHLLD